MHGKGEHFATIIALGVLIGATFLLDLRIPLGVAVGVLYVVAILVTYRAGFPAAMGPVAALCSVLVIAGYFLSPAGREIWFAAANRTLSLAIIWIAVWQGIAQSRAARDKVASEERADLVLHSALDAILTIDESGIIQTVNPATERLFGYQRDELLGQNVKMLMPEPYRHEHDDYLERYRRTKERNIIGSGREVVAQRQDGTTFPAHLAVSEMGHEGATRFVGTVRDITASKELERRITEAKEIAEAANLAKSQFLANMSHELRTPLNAIIGYSEMLEEELRESDVTAHGGDLEKINLAGRQLLGLINDILDLSKIEAGKLEITSSLFPVTTLVDETAAVAESLVKRGANRFEVVMTDDLGTMYGDKGKVRQVLLNIIGNAAKFTHGGVVKLSVAREALEDGDWLRFSVADTGIGMTHAQLVRVFDEFAQADKTASREYEGSGLGLAISRKLCKLMGGDIRVTSAPGEGSTFTVTLPADVESVQREIAYAEAELAERNAELPAGSGPLVLVIDDELSARDLMTRHLHRAGFQVAVARNGRDGLELARRLKPTAITLDILMPEIDGWEALRRLKADPELGRIPIIMCTVMDEADKGLTLGVADYLTKPIDVKRLFKTIAEMCPAEGASVLIVDDEEITRRLIRRELETQGARFTVHEASDGVEGLALLQRETIDLIILDLMMPHMNGFEFAEQMRCNPRWQAIPIVVLTAKDLTAAERAQLNERVELVVAKQAGRPGNVVAEVARLLRARSDADGQVRPRSD